MLLTFPPTPATRAHPRVHSAVVLGVLGTGLSAAGSWIPSFWGDEAASVMSAERPIGSLLAMVQRVDAVHGVYYLFLHFWITIFGASEFAVRFPSAIAVGIGAAGVVTLARSFGQQRVAVVAGIVFIVLPRVTYMGAEGRSYAMGIALAVWVTVLLVRLARHPHSRRWWAVYALGIAACIYLFMFLGLLLAVHGVWVLSKRGTVHKRWLASAACGVLLASPLIVLGYRERHQVAFIASRGTVTPQHILVDEWFGWPALAVVGYALMIAAVMWGRGRVPGRLLLLAGAGVVLPTTVLLLVNATIAPAYSMRYVSFSSPFVAVLIAAGIMALPWGRALPVGLAVVVTLAAPTYIGQRTAFAKYGGSDLRPMAQYVGSHAKRGDAIVFDESTRPSQRPRLALHLYPNDFAGVRDVELATSYARGTWLWDTTVPLVERTAQLRRSDTVWLIERAGSSDQRQGTDLDALERIGYRQVSSHPVHTTIVIELARS